MRFEDMTPEMSFVVTCKSRSYLGRMPLSRSSAILCLGKTSLTALCKEEAI